MIRRREEERLRPSTEAHHVDASAATSCGCLGAYPFLPHLPIQVYGSAGYEQRSLNCQPIGRAPGRPPNREKLPTPSRTGPRSLSIWDGTQRTITQGRRWADQALWVNAFFTIQLQTFPAVLLQQPCKSGACKALFEYSSVLTGPLVVALPDTNLMESAAGIHLPSKPI